MSGSYLASSRRTGRPEQQQPGQQHHGGHADEHQVVGKVVGRPGPDLVEPEQLVLDDAVIQIKAAPGADVGGRGLGLPLPSEAGTGPVAEASRPGQPCWVYP